MTVVAADAPPVLNRPVIILSAPRAGSTLLFETLAQAAGVYPIGGESHQLIESIAALRPGRGVVGSNRLTRKDATTEIVAGTARGGLPAGCTIATGSRHRRARPSGCSKRRRRMRSRVPFLLEVFPDAQFIFLRREPRANLGSMMQAWRGKAG